MVGNQEIHMPTDESMPKTPRPKGLEADLPFGFDRAEQLLEPFCACGHVVSKCSKSRRACVTRSGA